MLDPTYIWVTIGASLTCAIDGCILVAVMHAGIRKQSAALWAAAIAVAHLVFELAGVFLGTTLASFGSTIGLLIALLGMGMMLHSFISELAHEHDHSSHSHAPATRLNFLQIVWLVCVLSRDAFGLGAGLNGLLAGYSTALLCLSCLIVAVLVGFYTWTTARLVRSALAGLTAKGGKASERFLSAVNLVGLQILMGFTGYLAYALALEWTDSRWTLPAVAVTTILVSIVLSMRLWPAIKANAHARMHEFQDHLCEH
jgi:putative Mn2+ efflux pump MntP